MSVRVSPWKDTGKFMVVVRFRWPDRSVLRDRTVVDAKTEPAARRWGEQRERSFSQRGSRSSKTRRPATSRPASASPRGTANTTRPLSAAK